MWNLILANLNDPDAVGGEEAVEVIGQLDKFFNGPILNWIFWGITIFFVILVIMAGVSFAMAKSPEEKQAAKSKLVSLAIGLAIVFSASVLVSVFKGMIAGIWQ